jgi:hypothetical protein
MWAVIREEEGAKGGETKDRKCSKKEMKSEGMG